MPVERRGIELRQHEDPLQARMQTQADRDVDEAVLAADGHRRLRSLVGQRKQPGAAAATEDEREDVVHAVRIQNSEYRIQKEILFFFLLNSLLSISF